MQQLATKRRKLYDNFSATLWIHVRPLSYLLLWCLHHLYLLLQVHYYQKCKSCICLWLYLYLKTDFLCHFQVRNNFGSRRHSEHSMFVALTQKKNTGKYLGYMVGEIIAILRLVSLKPILQALVLTPELLHLKKHQTVAIVLLRSKCRSSFLQLPRFSILWCTLFLLLTWGPLQWTS